MFQEFLIMKKNSKVCGYSARHFRRIIATSVQNDREMLQTLQYKKKESKNVNSEDKRFSLLL